MALSQRSPCCLPLQFLGSTGDTQDTPSFLLFLILTHFKSRLSSEFFICNRTGKQSRRRIFKHAPGIKNRNRIKRLWLEKKLARGDKPFWQFKLCFLTTVKPGSEVFFLKYSFFFFLCVFFLCSLPLFYGSGKWARRKNLVWWEDLWIIFHHTNSYKLSFGLIVTITPNAICCEAMAAIKNSEGQLWTNTLLPP